MSAELTVVIMAYNEEVGLAPTVTTTLDFLTSKVEFEVLIVDDGSQDQTGPAADQLALSDPRVRVIHHQPNQGLGGVYRTGFAQARGEWLTFLPADGELPATNLGPFLDRR
ncbi:MAG: glycosyltransferase family 2 protein, partial [Candidatus Eremiobacteraeota bacterium]|nr:glycosyltransferase family 2 protein [Candidatus Eremiobacteraeota bacterium]